MDAELHSSRVAALQAEHFADDLHPPQSAASWPDTRLRCWFEFGGRAQPELAAFVEQQQHADGRAEDLVEALHGGGIYTLDDLVASAGELSSLLHGSLSVGSRSRLKLALSIEASRRRDAAAARELDAAERAADAAFRIAVAVANNENSRGHEGALP